MLLNPRVTFVASGLEAQVISPFCVTAGPEIAFHMILDSLLQAVHATG